MLNYRESVKEDATFLGPLLRDADKEELTAAWGETPHVAILEYAIGHSERCWTITHNEEPVGIFGHNKETLWMVATNELPKHRLEFLKKGITILKTLNQEIGQLYAASYHKNHLHHKWLLWLGFEYKGYDDKYFIFHKDAL